MKKLIAPLVLIVAVLAAAGVYTTNHRSVASPTPTVTPSATPLTRVSYQGQDGKDALTLLQAGHRLDIKQYSFGPFVTGIDGVAGTDSKSWILYVNGQAASVGADKYISKNGDQIEWRLEASQ